VGFDIFRVGVSPSVSQQSHAVLRFHLPRIEHQTRGFPVTNLRSVPALGQGSSLRPRVADAEHLLAHEAGRAVSGLLGHGNDHACGLWTGGPKGTFYFK
jgi:hypothetical protein